MCHSAYLLNVIGIVEVKPNKWILQRAWLLCIFIAINHCKDVVLQFILDECLIRPAPSLSLCDIECRLYVDNFFHFDLCFGAPRCTD